MKKNRKGLFKTITAFLLTLVLCVQPIAGAGNFDLGTGDGMADVQAAALEDGAQESQSHTESAQTEEGHSESAEPEESPDESAETPEGGTESPDEGTEPAESESAETQESSGEGTEETDGSATGEGTEETSTEETAETSTEETTEDGTEETTEEATEETTQEETGLDEAVVITAFAELEEDVCRQTVLLGTQQEELVLPEMLEITALSEEEEEQQATAEGIVWEADPENPRNKENDVTEYVPDQEGVTVFTPILPEGYELAEDTVLPEITVEVKKAVLVTGFEPLEEEVKRQVVEIGTSLEELELPASLHVYTMEAEKEEPQPAVVEDVTWKVDPEQEINKARGVTKYQPEKEEYTVFTAVLPKGYEAAEDAELPEITVEVRKQVKGGSNARIAGKIEDPITAFAMRNKLLNGFDTIYKDDDDRIGGWTEEEADKKKSQKVFFGKDYLGEAQKWWIAGKDPENPENLVLFAADTLLRPMQFRKRQKGDGAYDFPVETVKGGIERYVYGTWESSDLRKELKNAAENKTYFTKAEQELMKPSTIATLDRARLFEEDHLPPADKFPLNAWEQFSGTGEGYFAWSYHYFGPLNGDSPEIHYALEDRFYYETTDILYAPYGEKEYAFPTVGSGRGTKASKGESLPISGSFFADNSDANMKGSGNDSELMPFWLRSPGTDYNKSDATTGAEWHEMGRDGALLAGRLGVNTGINLSKQPVSVGSPEIKYMDDPFAVQPAFQLDTSNILFGSTAEAAANHAEAVNEGAELKTNDAMTLRYDAGKSLGTVTVAESKPDENGEQHQEIIVKGAPEGTYLVVQDIMKDNWGKDKNRAWAIPVKGNITVDCREIIVNDISLQERVDDLESWLSDGFVSNFRVWLEKTDNNITKASLADYRVSVSGDKNIAISDRDGKPETCIDQNLVPESTYDPEGGWNNQETWIWSKQTPFSKVICRAGDGYYFSDQYVNSLNPGKYGVKITKLEDGKTLEIDAPRDMDGGFYAYAPYAARTIVLPTPDREENYQKLTISKTVENEDGGEISEEAKNEAFAFELALSKDGKPVEHGKLTVTKNSSGTETPALKWEVTDTASTTEFSLKHGETITIGGALSGIEYTITEKPAQGYRTSHEVFEEEIKKAKKAVERNKATGTISDAEDVTVAYTNTVEAGYPVSFIKTADDAKTPLEGAEFKLYTCNGGGEDHKHTELEGTDSCWKPVQTDGKDTVYKSSANGKVDLGKLPAGEYLLEETKTAPGYLLPDVQWLLTVETDGTYHFAIYGDGTAPKFEQDAETKEWKLPNMKKYAEPLPETGGSGTGGWYLTALLLFALTGGSLLFGKGRKRNL